VNSEEIARCLLWIGKCFAFRPSLFVVADDVVLRQSSILRGSIRPALARPVRSFFLARAKNMQMMLFRLMIPQQGEKEAMEKYIRKRVNSSMANRVINNLFELN
jgi:hypothetical protein